MTATKACLHQCLPNSLAVVGFVAAAIFIRQLKTKQYGDLCSDWLSSQCPTFNLNQLPKFNASTLTDFITSASAFTDRPVPPTPDEITAELLKREADDQTKAWEREFLLNFMFPNRTKTTDTL